MKAGSLILNMFEQLQGSGLKQTMQYWIRQQMQKKLQGLQSGHLVIQDQWGVWSLGTETEPGVQISIHDPAFFTCVFRNGSNGAADAYRRGMWSCSSLKLLFQILIRNTEQLDAMEQGLAKLGVIKDRALHRLRANTRSGSSQNIHDHYDLGNDLFELFLDETMTYSSAIFADEHTGLRDASLAKLDLICQKLGLQPEHHVIEIGSGWGSCAIRMASRTGCRVTSLTLSPSQQEEAVTRVKEAGLEDRDLILAIGGEPLPRLKPDSVLQAYFERRILLSEIGKPLALTVMRKGERLELVLKPQRTPTMMRETQREYFEDIGLTLREFIASDAIQRREDHRTREGAIVNFIRPNSPAAAGDLKPGDWLKEIGGEPVTDFARALDLMKELLEDPDQDELVFLIQRSNETSVLRIRKQS